MNHITKLQLIKNRAQLAVLLGYSPGSLAYILYKTGSPYKSFSIPKKAGGIRTIDAPCSELKLLQRRLADYLQHCLEDIKYDSSKKSPLSHGFKKDLSIISNASKHKKKRYVFNLDLEDFFPSINFGRVRGFFLKNRYFQLDEPIATTIAQICCFKGGLPQGSPCSPIISNIIGHLLDIHLASLGKKCGCTYSRYADDITFSTNKKQFPSQIAVYKDEHWKPSNTLSKIIKKHGFDINPKKTRLTYKDSRQIVTGLSVNKKVSTKLEYRKNARSMTKQLVNTGSFYIYENGKKEAGTINKLDGILSFIDSVDAYHKNNIKNHTFPYKKRTSIDRNLNSREKNYKKFLFYMHFHGNENPTIVCEGKTDPIIIRTASQKQKNKFPMLIQNEKFVFKNISFTKKAARLMSLTGGAGDMEGVIKQIKHYRKDFRSTPSSQPVVFLVDNDTAGGKVLKIAQNIDGSVTTNEYVKFYEKCYVVPIVPLGQPENEIEDLFDSSVLTIKIGKKSFDRSSDYNTSTHYGKYEFATKIVKEQRDKIEFSNFDNLLDLLEKIAKRIV